MAKAKISVKVVPQATGAKALALCAIGDRLRLMSRLDDAITAFSRTLDRLEEALTRHGPGVHLPPPSVPGEIRIELDQLRAEKAMMSRELEAVRTENERLAALAEEAALQIEGTIAEVESVLQRSD